MQFYAIQTGETIWQSQARLDSLGGEPLSELGHEQAHRMGKQLVPHEPTILYCGEGQAERETAAIVGQETHLKPRARSALSEIDFGLWQGLTNDEIKRRHPKLHRQWLDAPSGVRPPNGESLREVQKRVYRAVVHLARREPKARILLVLRPVAWGLLRCKLLDASLDELWAHVLPKPDWVGFSLPHTKTPQEKHDG